MRLHTTPGVLTERPRDTCRALPHKRHSLCFRHLARSSSVSKSADSPGGIVFVLGLSGLPESQRVFLRDNPGLDPLDRRICQGMDSAACLVADGRIVAAAAEERFTGEKATGAFPAEAIDYVLGAAGITSDEVDLVAHGFNYDGFRRYFARTPKHFQAALSGRTVIDQLTRHGWRDVQARFRPVDHHLAHAASAYYPSGFEDALSIVSDGMGEITSLSVHHVRGTDFERLHHQGIETSLGIVYSLVTRYLGYMFNSDEYKVMGLSAYGDPTPFADFFEQFLGCEDGRITVGWDRASLRRPDEGYPDAMAFLHNATGVPPRRPDDEVSGAHADIAAGFQARFTVVLRQFVEHWLERTAARSLCLSGGTFLNCLANEAITGLAAVEELFIPPAAGDDGTAIGSALYVCGSPSSEPYTPYSGPGYRPDDVQTAIASLTDLGGVELQWSHVDEVERYLDLAARDIADDHIIGWFAGRMEFGPRALGNRSILALPRGRDVKDRLNHAVKLRESFRPFAPAILESDYDQYFENRALAPSRYMLCTARTRPGAAAAIAGGVHVDGTARVQIVRREDNELFWRLLTRVKELTGVGCVINTSFNVKNQPVIMDPATALHSFASMALDRLYIEGYRIEPTGAPAAGDRLRNLSDLEVNDLSAKLVVELSRTRGQRSRAPGVVRVDSPERVDLRGTSHTRSARTRGPDR